MKKKNNILYIIQHRLNRSPGQRYRCEQYLSYLEGAGFACTYSPLILNKKEEDMLYLSKNIADKLLIFGKGMIRRMRDVFRAKNYDMVFIYREAFYTGSTFFEKLLKHSGARIVLDFDDAIWLPSVSEANRSLQWLKRPEKIKEIIALSDTVIVGNNYLADYARGFNTNVVVFPSTLDLDYYHIGATGTIPDKKTEPVIIGWSGSHTTIEHFETIIPVFKKLKQKYGDKLGFEVYGDPHYRNDELNIRGMAWSPETEVSTIASFDIGIMPLPDNEWTRGKCAMKGIQYMGLAVPAVLAAVGMNKDVIEDGVNGYLAADEAEWFEKLSALIDNEHLRKMLGAAGRKTVEEKFSCQQLKDDYVNIFLTLSGQIK